MAKKKELDKDTFEKLCAIQCTKNEICNWFDGIDEKTLTRWCKDTYGLGFAEIYKEKSVKGLISLRRAQFRLAENNTSMAIFLGKQYLGQRDVVINDEELAKVDLLLSRIESEANDTNR